MEVAKVRAEPNTIHTANINTSATLPWQTQHFIWTVSYTLQWICSYY